MHPDHRAASRKPHRRGGNARTELRTFKRSAIGQRDLDAARRNLRRCGAFVRLVVEPDQFVNLAVLLPLTHHRIVVFRRVILRHRSQIPEVSPIQRNAQRLSIAPHQRAQRAIAQRQCLVPHRGRRVIIEEGLELLQHINFGKRSLRRNGSDSEEQHYREGEVLHEELQRPGEKPGRLARDGVPIVDPLSSRCNGSSISLSPQILYLLCASAHSVVAFPSPSPFVSVVPNAREAVPMV